MLCDNQGVIALAKDNKFHAHTKHIDLRHHFIREAVEEDKITMTYIPTKALARPKFKGFVKKLGLREENEKGKKGTKV